MPAVGENYLYIFCRIIGSVTFMDDISKLTAQVVWYVQQPFMCVFERVTGNVKFSWLLSCMVRIQSIKR
jgi:hypothetical protein